MSYQKGDLSEPMFNRSIKEFTPHAVQVFKSLLKLSGNRNSRNGETLHQECILKMVFGKNSALCDNLRFPKK
jgi:hypothetical protein